MSHASTPSLQNKLNLFSPQGLAKAIFDANVPEGFVRGLPAQSLYMALKYNGISSSIDTIEIASAEQCRLMLDLDLWNEDRFNEDQFWEWLALCDEEDGSFTVLIKVLKCIDLKLLAIIIARHVHILIFTESTPQPPEPGYYTPDKGFTWLNVKIADSTKHFLLSRFMALIFESNTELFYQLLGIPDVSTETILEEEAYQERQKRLSGEGIPAKEWAYELNSPIDDFDVKRALKDIKPHRTIADIIAIEPLIYESTKSELFTKLLEQVGDKEQIQNELTLIMNAAIVHWSIQFSEQDQVLALAQKVRGAINIGLEQLHTLSSLGDDQLYSCLGLQKIYRIGLAQLFRLRKLANSKSPSLKVDGRDEIVAAAILQGARESFPVTAKFLSPDGVVQEEHGVLPVGFRAIENKRDLENVRKLIEELLK